ncbi:MAG: hypothetical protein M3R72_02730 [Bacteroidota bacterium]|nr:hypothetical protein [Bacteroidota bacterium]
MKVLEVTQKVTDGKLVIAIPQDYEGKELRVTISENNIASDPDNWAFLPAEERVKILMQFAGSAKYPDTPIDNYEVYEQ